MMQQMLLGYTTDQGPGFTTYVVRQDSNQGGGCYIDLGANLFTSSPIISYIVFSYILIKFFIIL